MSPCTSSWPCWEPWTLHLAPAFSPRCLEFFGFTCQRSIFMLASFRCGSSTHQGIELGVLLAMALDRYIAICYSLRHGSIFTHQLVTNIEVGVTLRPAILVIPCLLLIKCHLKLYRTELISHTYYKHMALL